MGLGLTAALTAIFLSAASQRPMGVVAPTATPVSPMRPVVSSSEAAASSPRATDPANGNALRPGEVDAAVSAACAPTEGAVDADCLFHAALEAARAGASAVAFELYGRLLALSPLPVSWPQARYNRGLIDEGRQDFAAAVTEYEMIVRAGQGAAENTWIDAHYRLAVCLAKLSRYPEAVVAFSRVLSIPALDDDDRLEALVGLGIAFEGCHKDDAAEVAFSDALHLLEALQKEQRYDDHGLGAEAAFHLGNISSRRFDAVALAFPQAVLRARLEEKCEQLLIAQGRYLRSMRYGDHHTVAIAGLRVGGLYETLYDAIVALAPPADMTPEEVEIYREEVRKRVWVLVKKAIMVYEKALAAGKKTATADVWVDRLEKALTRLKTVYLSQDIALKEGKIGQGLTSRVETVQ